MISLVLAGLLAAAGAGSAPPPSLPPSSAPAETPAKPKADPNRMVCRYEEDYGTRFRTRICKTQAQWEAGEANARRLFQDSASKGAMSQGSTQPF